MTVTKSGGIIDVSNSSFVCTSGTPGIGVILAENQNYENWSDWFTNCDFTGDGNAPAFRNTGTGYLANVFLEGCTFFGTYQPSVGASQNNHVSGKIFNASGNPMTQPGWGGILSGPNSPELNLEWQTTSTGDQAGFHFGGVAFDTLINVLSNAPSEGYEQYKSNASPNDTLYIFMDNGWRNLDRTWASGVDSVLANGTSDTLAVTGIQTTSFVEVQLESDPGVNIGCPYHTKTANQDILIWPMACVNKFYYRWRIH